MLDTTLDSWGLGTQLQTQDIGPGGSGRVMLAAAQASPARTGQPFSVKKTMAAADKADPTIRHELGLVACTLSAMQLAWYSGLVKNDRQ